VRDFGVPTIRHAFLLLQVYPHSLDSSAYVLSRALSTSNNISHISSDVEEGQAVAGLQISESDLQRPPRYIAAQLQSARNSNKIRGMETEEKGELRVNACLGCLTSATFFNEEFTVGLGSTEYNEIVMCLVSDDAGDGGLACGRCIRLGVVDKCVTVSPWFLHV
jgi:hypothetical protein